MMFLLVMQVFFLTIKWTLICQIRDSNQNKSRADCHVQCRVWMCLEFWSLTSLRPTNGPWACLEVLAGSGATIIDERQGGRSSDTERRASGVDTHGAEREEGDNRLTSQISRINPDRCRRRSPSHPKYHTHLPDIYDSDFSNRNPSRFYCPFQNVCIECSVAYSIIEQQVQCSSIC